tara:strand:- start:77 stop:703 length:627 start_codon:yes stop_codon:yes gene_type:complete
MISKGTRSILVGLTGGIASGKSTVIQYLIDEGYSVIDADKLGHRVLDPGTPGFKKVVETFGKEILHPNGTVDRKTLGKIVFANPLCLRKLNEISHPIIAEMIQNEYQNLVSNSPNKIVFLEAALLIEAKWHKVCGKIWVVTLNPDIAMQRLQKRDGLNKTDARSRLDAQLTPAKRLVYADIVLKNDGLPDDLIFQTQRALKQLNQTRS